MTRFPTLWSTDNLQIAEAVHSDAPQLMAIFNACNHIEPWDPTFKTEPEETFTELVAKSVADGEGGNGRFQLQTICQKTNGKLIGYYHCSHHNPHPNTLWISMFVLHPDHQKSGFGTEFVHGLSQIAQAANYNAIWLDIFLKNWPALRFWIKSGFTTIIDIDGEPQHSASAHASMVAAKTL